jgi:hypothetical protein
MNKARRWVAAVLLVAVVGTVALGQQTPSQESWKVELDGRKTWTVRFGFGDALALAGASIGAGQLTLDQTMAVDFTATALSVLRVKGHFNDQEPATLQSLSLYLDMENIQGIVGDFTAPSMGDLFAGSRTMKGARLDVAWGDGSMTGIASRLSGVRDSRYFVGETALDERLFAGARADEGVSYASSLDGLGFFELEGLFVDDFTEVRLQLDALAELSSILDQYGVSELGAALSAFDGRTLDADEFAVVGEASQSLLLQVDPSNLVREAIREAIRIYNQAGVETPVSYPFVVGSDVEGEFLTAVKALAVVSVGGEEHLLGDLRWRRFYNVGRTKIAASSLSVAVSVGGGEFISTEDPSLVGYAITLYAPQGILDVAFPASFFLDPEAKMRVAFSYVVTGGTYMLGASVIPDSERVTMAGRALTRDVEYTIDYEIGMLGLLVEIGPSDPLVVEFERYSGGIGGSGSYTRGFYGATASMPLSETLSLDAYLLRGADERNSVAHPESVRIMPNEQTVVGVSGTITLPDFDGDFDVGYTNDVFPYDDNARDRVPNSVRAIAASADYVLIGSDGGFVAYTGGVWRSYGAANGLSGREVRAAVIDGDRAYLGTEGGLTVLKLTGVSALDKVANWSRYAEHEGLLDVSVRALLVEDGVLWIGTDGGLFRVAVDELADPDAWTAYQQDPVLQGIRSLCVYSGALYVGTTGGLVCVDTSTGAASPVDGAGSAVSDLASDGETLYVAGESGLQTFADGASTGWTTFGPGVLAVETAAGDVFYGNREGLTRVSDGDVFYGGWVVTSIHYAGDALWVGTMGSADGDLLVWRRAAADVVYDAATTKIDPWNPSVYADSAAGEHTTSGWMARGSFDHEGDGFSIAGSVDRALPGFRAIDASGRSNAGGWSVASDVELGPSATVSLDHSYRMSGIGSDGARATVDNRVAFQGSLGPQISLVVDHQAEDTAAAEPGFERNVLSYNLTVGHQLFDDALDLSITWGEGLHWDDGRPLRRETQLSTSVSLEVLPDLDTTFSWQRPVRITAAGATGSERWTWSTQGSLDVLGVGILGTYALDSSRSLSAAAASFVHKATLGASMTAFALGEWTTTPSLDLEGTHQKGATALLGRLSVRVGSADVTTRTVASVDVSGLGTRVERWSEKLTSTVSYSAIEGLRPSLSYTGARNVTRVEGQGSKASMTHSVNGRLTWSGADGSSESLAITGRFQDSGSMNMTLDNSYSQDVTSVLAAWIPALRDAEGAGTPAVFLRADLSGDWRRESAKDTANWQAGVSADVTLSSTWSLSLGLTYRGGIKTSVNAFHGLLAELTVAVDF